MEHMNHLVLKMKMYKIQVPVIYQCALLVGYLKRFGIESRIQRGYLSMVGSSCPHYWVETREEQLDIATELGVRYQPNMAQIPKSLDYTQPPDTKSFGEFSDELYELYEKNPKEFWKKRPQCLRNFKV